MKKRSKKGFTLVELLVVIGILAVLAVVSVVGYFGFIKKANISNDVSLTTQMNTILQASEAGGEKYETPHDAVKALEDGGLDVTKLTPTTDGYNYIYDSVNHKMVLAEESNGNFNVKAPEGSSIDSSKKENYFVFVSSADDVAKYSTDTKTGGWSIYLKDEYSDDTAYVSTSIDAGNNLNLKVINYTNTNENVSSIIRSNSKSTTVNVYAPKGVIKHYGEAKEVNIAEVAMSSYHENGSVLGNINVAKGNVEIESTGSVSNVVIQSVAKPATSASDESTTKEEVAPASGAVKVEVKENAEVSSVQSKSSDVKPSEVVSGSGASEVAKIEKNDNNVAYVGKVGYEDFNKALDAAKEIKGSTIVLTKNVDFHYTIKNNDLAIYFNNVDITIDLNSYNFNYNYSYLESTKQYYYPAHFSINNLSTVTIKNGTFTANNFNKGTELNPLFNLMNGSKLFVNNVDIKSNRTVFYPQGGASKLSIENSNVTTTGGYCIATNAGTYLNYNVDISVKNSYLKADYENGDNATVLINVTSTLNIENSTIEGHRQGLVVRVGTATVKNTTISADLSFTDSTYDDNLNTKEWADGNNLPAFPVVIGDTSVNAYNDAAICTFNNVKVSNTSTGNYKDRCVYLANDGKYATTFTYDSASTVSKYEVRKDSTVTVNGKSVVGA